MSTGHILVVDDEPQIRRVMRTTLVAEGYEVSDARTGADALELIRSEKYDLVLLDVNMPGISGLETCREIRTGSDLPIIMVTVRDAEEGQRPCRGALHGLDHLRMRVAQHHRPPGADVVDVALAIRVPQVRAGGSLEERRRAAHRAKRAHR